MPDARRKYIGQWRPHCYKCGRFLGKKDHIDIIYDPWNGGYEEGYSECVSCMKKFQESAHELGNR